MDTDSQIIIRSITTEDFQQWQELYKNYIAFQQQTYSEQNRDILWNWLMTDKVSAIVAETNNQLIGFAHYREMPHSLFARLTGFLDDLFVAKEYRGANVAQALMQRLERIGEQQNWLFIRWYTGENNYRAKAFYDKMSKKTIWHTYQLDINKAK